MGKEIPVVVGGFGPKSKCICDKTVAEVHGQAEREIRRRILDNIVRFKEDIDYIDLAERVGESHTLDLLLELGYAKQSITQAAHIYVLSERGYAKLIKIMDTDKAWDIEDTGNADGVFVFRNGEKIPYANLVKVVGDDV